MADRRELFPARAYRTFREGGSAALEWAMDRYRGAWWVIDEMREGATEWMADSPGCMIGGLALLLWGSMMALYVQNLLTGQLGDEAVQIAVGGLLAGTIMSLLIASVLAPLIYLVLRFIVPWVISAVIAALLFLPILIGCVLYGVGLAGLTMVELLLVVPLVLLWLTQLWYLAYWHIFYTCPHCSHRGQPLHVCPVCGEQYAHLWPSLYGHFFHICGRCETKLPTLDWLGRSKLERRCAGCGHRLDVQGRDPERLVAIVGAGSSGKTCYVMMLVRELLAGEQSNPSGMSAEIATDEDRADWEPDAAALDRGAVPAKTQEGVPRGFMLRLSRNGRRELVYLYDAAGEEYDSIRAFARHRQIEYVDGIILIVDPFALPNLRHSLDEDEVPAHGAVTPLEEIVDSAINVISLLRRPSADGRHDLPLAVVVSKGDTEPVRAVLGDIANGVPDSDRCRRALEQWGAGPSLQTIETYLRSVRYFACSALGREADGDGDAPFQATGVLEPLRWILEHRGRA